MSSSRCLLAQADPVDRVDPGDPGDPADRAVAVEAVSALADLALSQSNDPPSLHLSLRSHTCSFEA